MISMLLFILTAFAPHAARVTCARYMPMGPHMLSLHAKVDDAMSQISTDDGTSSIVSEDPEFVDTWNALDKDSFDKLKNKDTQRDAEKFFTERNATKGNAFGSTVIVNLDLSNYVAKENQTLAKHIKDFKAELEKIPDFEEYLDFQQNPHMTVSAVIMDRNVDEDEANEKFETANTNVKAIQEALRTIEDKNVTLKVEADQALKIPNTQGQFSIQFNGKDQSAFKKNADFEKMENDVRFNLMKRLNYDQMNFDKDMLVRAANSLGKIENWKKQPESMTEFQKVRFELIAKVGADVKDHFPAMALHIGQIKDPEALKRSEHQEKVAKLFADYKEIFARCTITMKGLQYVRYTSNSLRPNSITVLADANNTYLKKK